MHPIQVALLHSTQVALLHPTQVALLHPTQVALMHPIQVALLHPTQLALLHPIQVAALLQPYTQIALLHPTQVAQGFVEMIQDCLLYRLQFSHRPVLSQILRKPKKETKFGKKTLKFLNVIPRTAGHGQSLFAYFLISTDVNFVKWTNKRCRGTCRSFKL